MNQSLVTIDEFFIFIDKKNLSKTKKLLKKKIKHPYMKYYFCHDSSRMLSEFKMFVKKSKGLVGFINMNMTHLENDCSLLPEIPNDASILTLEGIVEKYNYNVTDNSIFWTNSQIKSSFHFILTQTGIKELMNIKKLEDLFKSTKIYNLTQQKMSQRINNENCLTVPHSKLSEKCLDKYPSVTLITVLNDENTFFLTILLFLKLRYSGDMEWLIVDDKKSAQKFLPKDDKRIKIIDIDNSEINYSFEYKLNLAAKYATNEIICNFLQDYIYFPTFLNDIIPHFIYSFKDCVYSNMLFTYDTKGQKTYEKNSTDYGMCIYLKNFWKQSSFSSDFNTFINSRLELCDNINSIFWGFKLNENDGSLNNFNITKLLTTDILESIRLCY